MKKIKLLTDTCSDINKEFRNEFDVDYFMHKIVVNGEEYPASLDWDRGLTYKEYFESLKKGANVKVSHILVPEFKALFEKYMYDYDIIFIASSSSQCAVAATATMIKNEILKEHNDVKIEVIDSLRSTCALSMIIEDAAKMIDSGLTFDEVVDKIKNTRNNYNEFSTVSSLEWAKKQGRVKAHEAFFGDLFGIKPIIIADRNGAQTPIKKVKGRKKSILEIVSLLKSVIDDESPVFVLDGYNSKEDLNFLLSLVNKELPDREVRIFTVGPVVGASTGPGSLGVFGRGKEVTFVAKD